MKLVIDRSTWLRGEGSDESRLLRSLDGKMCCLGFYSLACGLTDDHICDEATPDEIGKVAWPEDAQWMWDQWDLSDDCEELISTNDLGVLLEQEREQIIATIFAKHGVEVEFTG